MSTQEHARRQQKLRFNEEAITLALRIIEKLERPLDLLYYLMDHDDQNVVLILISSDYANMKDILVTQKRDTDLLFEIDSMKGLYAILCQGTKVDGGYMFGQRLKESIMKEDGKKLFSAELELRTTKYKIKDVLMRLTEMYLSALENNKDGEIVFKTLG